MTDNNQAAENPIISRIKYLIDDAFNQHPESIEDAKVILTQSLFQFAHEYQGKIDKLNNDINVHRQEFRTIHSICSASGVQLTDDQAPSEFVKSLSLIAEEAKRDALAGKSNQVVSEGGNVVNNVTHVHHHWHQPGVVEHIGDVIRAELGERAIDTVIENRVNVGAASTGPISKELEDALNSNLFHSKTNGKNV